MDLDDLFRLISEFNEQRQYFRRKYQKGPRSSYARFSRRNLFFGFYPKIFHFQIKNFLMRILKRTDRKSGLNWGSYAFYKQNKFK